MREIVKGATSQTLFIVLRDSTTGLGKTGLIHSDITGSYTRNRAARTAITMATLASASAAYSSGGFVEVDATNCPGLYRFDVPDAAFATGVRNVVVSAKATGVITEHEEVILTGWDNQDAVRGGLTALPNAAAEAAGGLYTRGTGAGQINQAANGMVDTNPVRLNNVAQSLLDLKDFADEGYDPATNKVQGVVLTDTVTTYTGNTPQTGDAFAAVGALNDVSTAEVQTAAAAALTAYDPPTHAELGGEIDAVQADIAALNDLDATAVQTAATAALTVYDPPTHAELVSEINSVQTDIAALNDVSSAEVQTAAAAALTAYDPPTKTELDTAQAAIEAAVTALNDVTAAEVVTALKAGTIAELTAGAFPQTPTIEQVLSLIVHLSARGGTFTKATGVATVENFGGTTIMKRTDTDDGSVFNEGPLVAP